MKISRLGCPPARHATDSRYLACLLVGFALVPAACHAQQPRLVSKDRDPVLLPATNSLVLGAMENRRAAGRNGPLSQLFSVEWEPFEDPTLQTWDAWWSRRIKVLEQGIIDDDEFEVVVAPWRDVPKEVPFRLLNSSKSGATTKSVLPGDFVLIRSANRIRVLVVAGRGGFGVKDEADKNLHTFFHYPLLWSSDGPKAGCKTLQLNTFPPRVTREISSVLLKASAHYRKPLPESVFAGQWLKPSITPNTGLALLGGCYLRLPPWQKTASGLKYCVVRLRPSILCRGDKVELVEHDLRHAINAARRAARLLRQQPHSVRAFRDAFGIENPTPTHYGTVAQVYEAFGGHMVKAVIIEAAAEREASGHAPPVVGNAATGAKGFKRLAFVKGRERFVIYLDPAYFELPPRRRSATLIHEFCHAWGMAGHPGTGDYGGQFTLVKDWLKLHGDHVPLSLNDPHRMVELAEVAKGIYRPVGFLPWVEQKTNKGLSRDNPYCYGYLINWNYGNFWTR